MFHCSSQNHRMLVAMENPANSDEPEGTVPCHLALHSVTIEKVFTDCVMDLHRIVVLDGIDMLPDGFRFRSHDLHGQLPEIVMKNSGDTFRDKDRLAIEACKLIAMARMRDRMDRFLPGCRFLAPTLIDGKAVVGLKAGPLTRVAEGADYITAYHELHQQVLG
jgi:hypothetical protein